MNIDELEKYISNNSVNNILVQNLKTFLGLEENDIEELKKNLLTEEFNELSMGIDYFEKSIADMKANWNEYRSIYDMLNDEKSRKTFLGMMSAKVMLDPTLIENVYSGEKVYYDETLFGEFENEVYVDCGGYTGDSVLRFITTCPQYKKNYVFEAVPQIADKCRQALAGLMEDDSIEVLEYAVSDKPEKLKFSLGNSNGDSRADINGELVVNAVTLDDIIQDKVSFIKMDIEGSEKQALEGARNIIKKYTPKMAICIYHLEDDFWKIPKLILDINSEYNFAVRQHDLEVYSETVLYCIPKTKQKEKIEYDEKSIYKRLMLANKQLYFYDQQENENLLQHVKDKKWFLKQLRGYTYKYKEQNLYVDELIKGKEWLEGQLEKQTEYVDELAKGKEWLEGQLGKQTEYVDELVKGKEWLEGQLGKQTEYVDELIKGKEWLQGELGKQTEYVDELTKGTAWLGEQVDNYKIENSKIVNELELVQNANSKFENELNELKNELAKTKYKLNKLTNDGLIKRIMRLKKYDF